MRCLGGKKPQESQKKTKKTNKPAWQKFILKTWFLRSFACCLCLCSWGAWKGDLSSSRPVSGLLSPVSALPVVTAVGTQHRAGGCREVHTCSWVHWQHVKSFTPVSLLSFSSFWCFFFLKLKTLERILKHEADVLSKNNCSLAAARERCSCISGRRLQTANCSGSLSAFAACKWHYYSLIAAAHCVVFWLVSSYSASQRQGKRNVCLSSSQFLTS